MAILTAQVLIASRPAQYGGSKFLHAHRKDTVGEQWAGPAATSNEAEALGYETFGIGPLYIKRVTAEEPVDEISRDIAS